MARKRASDVRARSVTQSGYQIDYTETAGLFFSVGITFVRSLVQNSSTSDGTSKRAIRRA